MFLLIVPEIAILSNGCTILAPGSDVLDAGN